MLKVPLAVVGGGTVTGEVKVKVKHRRAIGTQQIVVWARTAYNSRGMFFKYGFKDIKSGEVRENSISVNYGKNRLPSRAKPQ